MELQFHPGPARKLYTNWHCPKHVEFHAKNKICEIRESSWSYYKEISYDARSHERKIPLYIFVYPSVIFFL